MSKKPNIEKYFNNESLKRKNKSHSQFLSSEDIDSTDDINSYSELYNNNISEFYSRIDDYEGYFTTQQIESIDYSSFAEHVFFDSALEKVNFAYSNILNYFPYDKSFFAVDQYLKKLSGFERYLLSNKIECSTNYFNTEGSYYVEIKDQNGIILDDFQGLPSFKNFNPLDREFSFDFNLYVDNNANNNNKFVFYYDEDITANNNSGNTLISLQISDLDDNNKTCRLNLELKSEESVQAVTYKCTITIETDAFVHLNFSVEKFFSEGDIKKRIVVYKNGKKINFDEIGSLDQIKFVDSGSQSGSFYIGKADSIFNGLIDEFRYYIGKSRSQNKIVEEKNKNVYGEDSLALYLKFNEPSGVYDNNNLIIDSSGKKLHGIIILPYKADYERSGLLTAIQTPLIYEKTSDNPVLFMNYGQNSTNKLELQEEAKFYDLENPNSFWKLLPKNIFIEGSDFDNIGEVYVSNESADSQKVLGESKSINQTLIKIFSIWARFFDELKLYIDSLSEIINLNYDSISSNKKIDGIVLPLALKSMGFDFKEIFSYPISTKLDGKNLTYEKELSSISIRQIQNILWKRFLINSQDYVTSKGTKNSLRTIFNSFGLEVDRFVKIREITGQNIFNIQNNFYESIVYKDFIDFSKINTQSEEGFLYTDDEAYELGNSNRYRRLPDDVLNLSSYDNYFDSRLVDINKNWNFECLYRFNPDIIEKIDKDQSLVRFNLAESKSHIQRYSVINSNKNKDTNFTKLHEDANKFQGPYIEVYFERKKKSLTKGKIVIKIDQMLGYDDPLDVANVYIKDKATLEIEDVDLMSGQIYLLNVSKKRISAFINKYEFNISSIGNSSYSSTVRSVSVELDNKFYKINTSDNTGTYNTLASGEDGHDKRINITIGPERYRNEIADLLSDPGNVKDYITNFQGFVSNIRLFNRSLSKEELRLKRKDIEIISNESVDNANLSTSGLDRTMLNIELKEDINAEYSNETLNEFKTLELYSLTTISDDSQGKDNIACYLTCTKKDGYENKDLFFRDKISVLRQASEIDMPVSHNNVYINSFEQESYKDEFLNINKTGLSQTPPGFVYNEDLRMYIDFSMVNFINQDISKILIANDFFTKMLNNTSNFYEEEYKSLEVLRQKYFKRLSSDLNIDILYQVYKYFDNILSDLLQEAVPSKVNYLGFNFVYESHLLERNKYRHKMSNSRLPVVDVNNYSNYNVYDKKIRTDDVLDFDETDKSVVRNKR